jgi:magnesium transporter
MQRSFISKNLIFWELINPNNEEILDLSKKLKIKEIDLKSSLAPQHFSEFIYETNYLGFGLLYPVFINKSLVFKKVSLFLSGKNLVILRKDDKEIRFIWDKTLNFWQKSKFEDGEIFITLFILNLLRRYFPLLKTFSHSLYILEKSFNEEKPLIAIEHLSILRRKIIFSHTATNSILNMINQVMKTNIPLVKYNFDRWESIQDISEFILQKIDDYEKILEGLSRSFETKLSFQINESVRFLTFIQSLFLPSTLIASIYGMNITLPLAESKYAFLILSLLMIVTTLLLLKLIKRI